MSGYLELAKSGEWHEVRASDCLPGVVQSVNRCPRKKGEVG